MAVTEIAKIQEHCPYLWRRPVHGSLAKILSQHRTSSQRGHGKRDTAKETSKMQSGTGIQELMAAETRASQIVAEARIGE